MDCEIVRIHCEESSQVKVVRVFRGGEDRDLLVARPDELVQCHCRGCDQVTDHVLLPKEEEAAA